MPGPQAPPFFIVANDRSGTTMLRLVLDRGDVAIPPESMFLLDFASVRRGGGLDDPRAAAAFVRRVWEHPRVRLWSLPGEPPEPPAGLGHEDAFRFAVEAPFRAYAHAEGKARWADKTPLYLTCVDDLAAIWPDARFVVLVRDGRDVALSLMGVPFGPNNVWSAARFWANGIRLGLAAAARHPDRVLHIRYEDLVADPVPHVRRVCAFVGLEYRDDMLAIERTDPAKVVKDQEAWFTNVWAGINARGAGKWREAMAPRSRRVFEAVARPELERMGYEVDDRSRDPELRAARHLYRAHDTAARILNFVRLRIVRERGRELGYVVRRKLAGAWR